MTALNSPSKYEMEEEVRPGRGRAISRILSGHNHHHAAAVVLTDHAAASR